MIGNGAAAALATTPLLSTQCSRKSDQQEIVVCGSRSQNESYRVRPLPRAHEHLIPQTGIGLGGGLSEASTWMLPDSGMA